MIRSVVTIRICNFGWFARRPTPLSILMAWRLQCSRPIGRVRSQSCFLLTPPSPAVRALFRVSGRRPLFENTILSPVPSSSSLVEGPTDEDFRKDHVTQLIALYKRLDIQPSVHRSDTLSPSIYAADKAEAIGKMYALLPLEAADEWH